MKPLPIEPDLRALSDAATPGPWSWFGDATSEVREPYLATVDRGRVFVMQFARLGMRGAQPVFQVRDGEAPGNGVMRTAKEIGPDWSKHPDAALIVAAVNDLRARLAAPVDPGEDVDLLADIAEMAVGEVLTGADYERYHVAIREHFRARLVRARER